jgi:hypothetical protein
VGAERRAMMARDELRKKANDDAQRWSDGAWLGTLYRTFGKIKDPFEKRSALNKVLVFL